MLKRIDNTIEVFATFFIKRIYKKTCLKMMITKSEETPRFFFKRISDVPSFPPFPIKANQLKKVVKELFQKEKII